MQPEHQDEDQQQRDCAESEGKQIQGKPILSGVATLLQDSQAAFEHSSAMMWVSLGVRRT